MNSEYKKSQFVNFVALLCAIILGVAFLFMPWTRMFEKEVTGFGLLYEVMSRSVQGDISLLSLLLIPFAAGLGGLAALWGLLNPTQKVSKTVTIVVGVIGLIYYGIFFVQNNQSLFDAMDVLGSGFFLGLFATIGLVVQAFIPYPTLLRPTVRIISPILRPFEPAWDWITKLDISDRKLAFLLISPAAILIVLFALYPSVQGLFISLFKVENATLKMTFTGLDNYYDLLGNKLFWDAVVRTIKLVVVSTGFQLILGLGISMLVHQELVGRNLARGIVLFPYLVPAIVIALTWRYMLDPTLGVINRGAIDLGLITRPIPFLSRPDSAMAVVIFAGIWKYTPFFVIMLLARLQVIPLELEEAAELDGASSWQVFRYITLPWLMPVIIIALLLRTIWTFNEYEMVYLFASGGPLFGTTTLPVLVQHLAFVKEEIGQAAATSTIMVMALLIMAWGYFGAYARAESELY